MVFIPTRIVTTSLEIIPDVDKIVDEAIERLSKTGILTPEKVKTNFSDALATLEKTADTIYREYELKALENLKKQCLGVLGNNATKEHALDYTFPLVKEFEFRVGRSRKTRVGRALRNAVSHELWDMLIQCDDRLASFR
jgi:hypothetical protein